MLYNIHWYKIRLCQWVKQEHFLSFIQSQLEESKISAFVEAMSTFESFSSFIDQWLEEDKGELEEDKVEDSDQEDSDE